MKYLLYIFIIISLSGCSVFQNPFKNLFKKKNEIPLEPSRDFYEDEDIKKNVDIIKKASYYADKNGMKSNTYESKTLKSSADVMTIVTGVPAEDIDWKDPKQVKELHDRIRSNELELRRQEHSWKLRIDSLSRDKDALQEENGTLKKFKDWFWLSAIALGALTFLFPTVGVFIIKFLISKTKKLAEITLIESGKAMKGQFNQVTKAIDNFKKEDPDSAKKLLDHLKKETDTSTRKLITEIRNQH